MAGDGVLCVKPNLVIDTEGGSGGSAGIDVLLMSKLSSSYLRSEVVGYILKVFGNESGRLSLTSGRELGRLGRVEGLVGVVSEVSKE